MKLGNPNTMPFLAKEVEHVVLMVHEFFNKGHFYRCTNGILLLCSLMNETPFGKATGMDYFLRVYAGLTQEPARDPPAQNRAGR